MNPERLAIGRYEYTAPDKTDKERKKEAKLLKKSGLENCSMIAELVGDTVKLRYVETDTFGADEELYELLD